MKKALRIVIVGILFAILIFSVTQIVAIQLSYKEAAEIYEESRAESFHISEDASSSEPAGEGSASTADDEYFPEAYADVDELMSLNPDIVGWIWIPSTNVNFPLLKGEDNIKYLTQSYNLKYTGSGGIFMDYRSSSDLSSDNTVIYGHNMKNGSMFGSLKKFSEIDYLTEHDYIYIFTADRILKYRIFAAYKTQSTSESYTMEFSGDISYDAYTDYVLSCAGSNLTELPETQTPLLMLSTCTSVVRTERFVVHACLIAEKENIEN